MRRVAGILTIVLMLMAGINAPVGATAAQGAGQPYSYEECFEDPYYGAAYVHCHQAKGVVVTNYTDDPLHPHTYHNNGRSCSQLYVNGELTFDRCDKYHYVAIFTDGGDTGTDPQINHSVAKWEYTVDGMTCSVMANQTYANGEIRHIDYDSQCS